MARSIFKKVSFKGEGMTIVRKDGRRERIENFTSVAELEEVIKKFVGNQNYKIEGQSSVLKDFFVPVDIDYMHFYKLSEKYQVNIEFIAWVYDELMDYDELINFLENEYTVYQMNDRIQANLKFENKYGLSFKNGDYQYLEINSYEQNGKDYFVFYGYKGKLKNKKTTGGMTNV